MYANSYILYIAAPEEVAMSFKEISAWLVLIIFAWLFVDYALPLFEARNLGVGDGRTMISSVIIFVVILVIAHIWIGILRRKPAEEDERDRAIEARSETFGGLALGAVAMFTLFYALQKGDISYANLMFLGLVFSEIIKRASQVIQYRLGA